MTLKAGLEELPEMAETSSTLSWRAWLLLPLALIGLAGIVVPLTNAGPASDPSFRFEEQDEEEDLVPYDGELQILLNRPEIAAWQHNTIKKLHTRLTSFAERNKDRITRADREIVDEFLRQFR